MSDYSLGVLGGMGPMATSLFLDKLVKNTAASNDQDHINTVVLDHATIPDRTEAILTQQHDAFLRTVEKDFRIFEQAGVSNIAIPCNTSHYFYDRLQKMTNIPIIHMIEVTMQYMIRHYGQQAKIGLLATNGTISSGVYERSSGHNNLHLYHPDQDIQQEIMDIIYRIKAHPSIDPQQLDNIITYMLEEENCDGIILGCTELSCVPLRKEVQPFCIDPLALLVRESILSSGKQLMAAVDKIHE